MRKRDRVQSHTPYQTNQLMLKSEKICIAFSVNVLTFFELGFICLKIVNSQRYLSDNQLIKIAHFPKKFYLGALIFIFSLSTLAQSEYAPPLNIPLLLSGSFGELRKNHFHSGLDIKTESREGLAVFAVQEGYVSRIRVSPWGYGKAIYIDHPNGNTSVYGHLSAYSDSIAIYVRNSQYELESFSVDLFPEPGKMKVEKGQLIAYSGNSGGSGGPHLHFELRETKTEQALNPLICGFSIKDEQSPEIKGLKIYPIGDSSSVDGIGKEQIFQTDKTRGNCKLVHTGPVILSGKVGFAIHTNDQLSGTSNICGVYRVKMLVDGKLYYEHVFDRLSFDEKRGINAHRDYLAYRTDNRDFQRTFVLPNQNMVIYKTLENKGIVNFKLDGDHTVKFEVEDFKGNKSTLDIIVKGKAPAIPAKRAELKASKAGAEVYSVDFEKEFSLDLKNVQVKIPALHLFDDLDLTVRTIAKPASALSEAFEIGNSDIPLLNPIEIGIRKPIISKPDFSKILIAKRDPRTGKVSALKPKSDENWFKTEVTDFGVFYLMADTIAPIITAYDFKKEMKGRKKFVMKVSDNFAGVDYIEGRIDGKWIIMDFDPKTASVTHHFDPAKFLSGSHKFKMIVKDAVGNETVYESSFNW